MAFSRAPYARELIFPCSLCAGTLAVALAMCIALGIRGAAIMTEYCSVSLFVGPLSLYLWLMIGARKAEFRKSVHRQVADMLRERWLVLLLPMVIFPVFMTAFTTLKCAFPLVTGYRWDSTLAAVDMTIFGEDPWRITHALIGPAGTWVISMAYTAVWGIALGIGVPLYSLYAPPRDVIRAFSALMLTWLVVGVVGAALLSSAGPVFAGAVDPTLAEHFKPLHQALAQSFGPADPVTLAQAYLARDLLQPLTVKGGGVSAMPSMHLGVCTFLVLLAGKTHWRWPAVALTAIIWVGSVHFGYHYAVDGLVAVPLAMLCWWWVHRHQSAPAPVGARLLAAA